MIFTKGDVIAQFIVRKLYRYFVYYNITPDIETNVIIPLANDFKADWQIKPLLAALLKSAHFYDNLFQLSQSRYHGESACVITQLQFICHAEHQRIDIFQND